DLAVFQLNYIVNCPTQVDNLLLLFELQIPSNRPQNWIASKDLILKMSIDTKSFVEEFHTELSKFLLDKPQSFLTSKQSLLNTVDSQGLVAKYWFSTIDFAVYCEKRQDFGIFCLALDTLAATLISADEYNFKMIVSFDVKILVENLKGLQDVFFLFFLIILESEKINQKW
ncbi:MAG: hypothetical protein MHPSP_004573, partial [Paramarteilia canceri]